MNTHMIPPFNHEGLLPPFVGDPARSEGHAPYRTSFAELVRVFGTSERRLQILAGFATFRRRLFQVGIRNGFQWVCGSFVQKMKREPGDIDAVTVFHTDIPRQNFESVFRYNPSLFYPDSTKALYKTDAYFVDVAALDYYFATRRITFWFGLFSHTKEGHIWKGVLEIPLPGSTGECDAEFELVIETQGSLNG